ncbi:MAG: hypothetical protein ACKOBP_15765 [Planctomycetia bacterium]
MHGHAGFLASAFFVATALPAPGQVRVVEELALAGSVEAVSGGLVTVRDERERRLQIRIQRPDDKGVALTDGRLLTLPAECRVGGVTCPH